MAATFDSSTIGAAWILTGGYLDTLPFDHLRFPRPLDSVEAVLLLYSGDSTSLLYLVGALSCALNMVFLSVSMSLTGSPIG